MVILWQKIVCSINSKTLTILTEKLFLVTGLGPRRVTADGYTIVLKIQMDICKDGRRVKIGPFEV